MIQNTAYTLKGTDNKLISADLTYSKYNSPVPICVFIHGFKGFKDWGAWPLAAEIFAIKQLPFFKFNFSHNGTSPKHLTEFVDLEAFGNNNFKRELDEVGLVIDFIENKQESFDFQWNQEIYVIGHSRGGGIALLATAQDGRIDKCAVWAGVSDFDRYMNLDDHDTWKSDGVTYIENGRTGQQMPINFQFVESFNQHRGLLNIQENIEDITAPTLLIHGTEDKVVDIADAHKSFETIAHSIIVEIENADHTFNTKHPLTDRKIPKAFVEVITETIEFFQL